MNCKAPFVHTRIDIDNRIFPCSSFIGDFDADTLIDGRIDKVFYGDKYQKFRQQMKNYEYIHGCQECKIDFELGLESHRDYFNKKYFDVNKPELYELELCLSNRCNFQCVMCNSIFSSSLYHRDQVLNDLGIEREGQTSKKKFLTTSIDLKFLNLKKLNRLRILGGEPIIENNFLKIFSYLESIGKISEITLTLNTNNSVFPSNRWIKFLKKFKKIDLVFSLDSIGQLGEYCRRGLKFYDFKENRKKWEDTFQNLNISFNSVIHNISIFGITELIEYIDLPINYGMEGNGHSLDLILMPNFLTLRYLPDHVKNHIIRNLDDRFKPIFDFMSVSEYDEKSCMDLYIFLNYLNDFPMELNYLYNEMKTIYDKKNSS